MDNSAKKNLETQLDGTRTAIKRLSTLADQANEVQRMQVTLLKIHSEVVENIAELETLLLKVGTVLKSF